MSQGAFVGLSKRAMKRKGKRKGTARVDPLLTRPSMGPLMVIKGPVRPEVEVHYVDLALAAYGMDTTGSVTALNLIAEGNDNTTRLGRKATMRSVSVRGYVVQAGVANVAQQGRLLVVWDNAAAGALPVITDVLTAITSSSFVNVNNVARFTVLYDNTYEVGSLNTGATVSIADQTVKKVDVELRVDSSTQFSGTTAAIGSIQNGTLLLLTMGSSAAAGNAGLTAALSTRVTFVDVL